MSLTVHRLIRALATVAIGPLGAGQAQRGKLSVPLPAGVTNPANAHLFIVADDGGTVPEGDETNNVTRFDFGLSP